MIELRILSETDVVAFREMRLESLQTHPEVFLHPYDEEKVKPESFHLNMLKASIVMGAFVEHSLAGLAFMDPLKEFKLRHKAYIWGVYVQPKFRKLHIARTMYEELFSDGKKKGISIFLATVIASNTPAVRFHKSMGFNMILVEKNGLRQFDGGFDDLIYAVKYA